MSTKIKAFQSQLNSLGFSLVEDGKWGPKSQKALDELVSISTCRVYFDFNMFRKLFGISKITQNMVDNINYLFDEFNSLSTPESTNPLYIAYMLATTWHETAMTFMPVKEAGSWQYLSKYDTGKLAKILGNTPEADGDGQLYAGRGYVQITGKNNYKKFSSIVGEDLIKNPDFTLRPRIAARILVEGSLKGMFTGKKLSDYIRVGSIGEFVEARRVINGTDKASLIASHAIKFLDCLVIEKV